MAILKAMIQPQKKKVEMVETEMGRMVPKAQQEKWNKGVTESMNKQYFSRNAPIKSMNKERERKALFEASKKKEAEAMENVRTAGYNVKDSSAKYKGISNSIIEKMSPQERIKNEVEYKSKNNTGYKVRYTKPDGQKATLMSGTKSYRS